MTKLLEGDTLWQMAQIISLPDPRHSGMVPVMRWHVDERSQRPVCLWTLEAKSPSSN